MKVIHTWTNTDETLPKHIAYGQMLSALLAKKHYGNIHLYTTEKLGEKIRDMGVPYDSINTTLLEDGEPIDSFSVPKIKVFQDQKQEFLHIDLDTYMYEKIDFDQYESPAIFSHPDFGVRNLTMSFDEMISGLFSKFRHPVVDWREQVNDYDSMFWYMLEFYIGPFVKFIDTHPLDLIKHVNFSSIPNMNIVHIKHRAIEDFNRSCTQSLVHYKLNKVEIDKLNWGACYVEQFYLHAMLLSLNEEYRKACSGTSKPKNCVFPHLPFNTREEKDGIIYSAEMLVKVENEYIHTVRELPTEEERREFFGNNITGFFHSTHSTKNEYVQAHIINRIVELFGQEYVRNIQTHYSNSGLSEGELKYMELFNRELYE